MNKLFKKFCGSINYNTYNNMESILFATGLTSGLANAIMNLNNVEDFGLLGFMSSFSYFAYIYFNYSNGENYTKDINEVRKLYDEFINNYNKMNKDFCFNEPISIYVMFNYLLSRGYLSLNKNFEISNVECIDFRFIRAVDVLNGNGVCRHISSMLTDILNGYDISAANVSCYAPTIGLDVMPVSKEIYSRDENNKMIYKYLNSSKDREFWIQSISSLEEDGIYFKIYLRKMEDNDKSKSINHLITYALHDGKSYYLDPTQSRIYRFKEKSKGNLYDEYFDGVLIKSKSFRKLNNVDNKNIRELKKNMFVYNDSVSLEEEKKIISSTIDICERNMDIFDHFYNENKELYGEIVNASVKVKKKVK